MLTKPIRRSAVWLGVPLAMALALQLTAPPASAEDLTIHFSSRHYGKSHHTDRHHFEREHHRPDHAHSRSGDRHRSTHQNKGHHFTERHHEHERRELYSSRKCRTVTKQAYQNGRLAKIAGKLCYDRYGNPYIVRGSRHVVSYYD